MPERADRATSGPHTPVMSAGSRPTEQAAHARTTVLAWVAAGVARDLSGSAAWLAAGEPITVDPLALTAVRVVPGDLIARARPRNAGIGRALFISPFTVRNHGSSIVAELQVSNRRQAMLRARAAPGHNAADRVGRPTIAGGAGDQ